MAKDAVFISGSASGIGKAVAQALAGDGVPLALADVDVDAGTRVADELGELTTAKFYELDVSDAGAMSDTLQSIVDDLGPLGGAVNNAGIGGANAPTGDYPVESWRNVISVNLDGVFFGMRSQIPLMLDNGGGRIVNIASILGDVGFSGAPAYVAAKHGVVGLTQTAAQDHAKQNLQINAVAPGFIETPLLSENETLDDEAMQQIVAMHPIGRLGRPEEVASVVRWLLMDAPDFLTGAYIPVDGGYLAR